MKYLYTAILSVALASILCACGMRNNTSTTPNTTMIDLPDMSPTINTNIPDPDINETAPDFTTQPTNNN